MNKQKKKEILQTDKGVTHER